MTVMAAAVVVFADDGTGTSEPTPTNITYVGSYRIGGFPAREFRSDTGAIFVVQRIRSGGTPKRWLCIVWTAAASRAVALTAFQALTATYGLTFLKAWRVTLDADGIPRVPDLDIDSTTIGTLANSAWPSGWRSFKAGDTPSTFEGSAGTPTGPVFIGSPLI